MATLIFIIADNAAVLPITLQRRFRQYRKLRSISVWTTQVSWRIFLSGDLMVLVAGLIYRNE